MDLTTTPAAPDVVPLSSFTGGCSVDRAKAKKAWPDGIPLTDQAAVTAAELDVDLAWAANRLLRWTALCRFREARHAAVREREKRVREICDAVERFNCQALSEADFAYRLKLARTLLALLLEPANRDY